MKKNSRYCLRLLNLGELRVIESKLARVSRRLPSIKMVNKREFCWRKGSLEEWGEKTPQCSSYSYIFIFLQRLIVLASLIFPLVAFFLNMA